MSISDKWIIRWYYENIEKTNKILKISKKNAYKQYLAYYKGWGEYKNYSKVLIFSTGYRFGLEFPFWWQ